MVILPNVGVIPQKIPGVFAHLRGENVEHNAGIGQKSIAGQALVTIYIQVRNKSQGMQLFGALP